MQRSFKAGILLLVLVVPAFVFLFLKLFGQNHFQLTTFYPLRDPATGAVRFEERPSKWWGTVKDTAFYQLPVIVGTDPAGKPVTSESLAGSLYVASFAPTECDSNCRQVAAQLNRIQDIFEQQDQLKLLTLAADTASLRPWLDVAEQRPEKWQTLLVGAGRLDTLAARTYRFVQEPTVGKKKETLRYNDGLVLVDKEGHIRGYYKGSDKTEVDRLNLEVRVLLDIYAKQ